MQKPENRQQAKPILKQEINDEDVVQFMLKSLMLIQLIVFVF